MIWLGAVRQPTTESSFERALRASNFCGQTRIERCQCMHSFAWRFNDAGADAGVGAQVSAVLLSSIGFILMFAVLCVAKIVLNGVISVI